jgi:mannose-6-phosphate isomerase
MIDSNLRRGGKSSTSLKAFIVDRALPLWASIGWDADQGGFVERLDKSGKAEITTPRRVRVQARQIYCFAMAADLGWYPPGKELALKGLDYLIRKARDVDGKPGFGHLLAQDGTLINSLRDSYDHAFVLLALATVYRLTKDSQVRGEIDATMSFIEENLRSPHGGYVEGIPASQPRRQNPHMHLFEAMIALFDATHDMAFQQRAGDIFALFVSSFYDPQARAVGEYFEDDWSKILPIRVEPGHQAEWVWLLKEFERITGCPTSRYRAELLSSAMRYRDTQSGCLLDEGDVAGRITQATRRLWPQTEIVKAWLTEVECNTPGAREQALAAIDRLTSQYLTHPVAGGWYDQFDGDGRTTVDFIPASSFYHLVCAAAETERVLGI